MSERARHHGPYHRGELEVQRRAGVLEDAERVGRIIGSTLFPPGRAFLAQQRLAVTASTNADGQVWASLLTGPSGFLAPVDDELLLVDGVGDELLLGNLAANPQLGLLVIDLERRRRLRVNGRALVDGARVFLAVEQAYANCSKYIQARRVEPITGATRASRRSSTLDARQQAWITSADCLFVASRHPEGGADASHRGGLAGFVTVHGPRSLSFEDYPGNNMFNTLGNIASHPEVGLLFLDFEQGALLQLTGRAHVDWTQAERDAPRARVVFELDTAIQTDGAGVTSTTVASARRDA